MKRTIQIALTVLGFLAAESVATARGGFVAGRGGVAVGRGGGVATSRTTVGGRTGAFGGAQIGGAQGRSYTSPNGTRIDAGRVGGVSQGPLGGTKVGGAQGVRVTTPTGQTYSRGSAGSVGVGPLGGTRVSGAQGSSVTGSGGTTIRSGSAGSINRGPLGGTTVRGGSGTQVIGAGGRSITTGRAGSVGVGPLGGVRVGGVSGTAIGGPRGGIAVGARGVGFGHSTWNYSPTVFRSSAAVVRTGSYRYGYFNRGWYTTHRTAWIAPRWVSASIWAVPTWAAVATYARITAPPIIYDYGNTVVIQNDAVYVNGVSVGAPEVYATEAASFADVGRTAPIAENEEWQALGVFGLIKEGETEAQRIFQLGINPKGVIRGNYYDAISDTTLPVYGSVDARSQRAAWSVGEKRDVVFETGINNLTQNETSVLIHFGKDRSEQMFLVRLEEPQEQGK